MMSGSESKDFFTDISLIGDPAPYFHDLRSKCPVLREPHHGAMMVTGYAEALEVFKQRDVFSSCVAVTGPIPPLPFTPQGDDVSEQISRYQGEMPWSAYLVTLDGQAHGVRRAILNSLLTHTRLRKNEEYVLKLCDRLIVLDRMRDIRICDAEHGPAAARRYDYVPTYLLRGLSALHLEYHAAT